MGGRGSRRAAMDQDAYQNHWVAARQVEKVAQQELRLPAVLIDNHENFF
jgi:hypothetical protein